MNSRLWSILAGTVGTLAMFASDPLLAQQVSQSGSALEEIVVTARRREEAIQTVPIAINAFNQDQLNSNRVVQFNDLQHYVPSLRQFGAAFRREQDQVQIRALPGSITYLAEAKTSAAGPGFFFDLQNMQILKGPQGTLFGGLASGGAILMEPRLPNLDATEGYGQIQFGNYNDREYEAAINVPILKDKVGVRLAMVRQEREGFTTDVGPFFPGKKYDNRDNWAFRLGVLIKPVDWISNYTMIDTYYRHTTSTGNKAFLFGPPVTSIFPAALLQQVLAEQAAAGPRGTSLSTDQLDKDSRRGILDRLIVDVTDNITLKNIFSYREVRTLDRYEIEGSRLPLLDRPATIPGWRNGDGTLTEEINANGQFFNNTLKVATGFYYEHGEPVELTAQRGIAFGSPSAVPEQGHGEYNWSRAFFGQGSYNLGGLVPVLDGLSLTAGARRSTDFRQTANFQYNPVTGVCTGRPGFTYPNCLVLPTPFKGSVWTYTFGVDYQIDPTTLVYVARRKGYRAGTVNLNAPTPELQRVKPESVWDVEVGLKKDWDFNGAPARTNFALYHADYTDIQRTVGFFNAATNTAGSTTSNAAKAVMQGFEFDGTLVPFPALELGASYTMSIAYYKSYTSFNTTRLVYEDLSGLAFASNPRHKYNLSAKLHMPIPETMGDVSVSLNYFHQSAYWGSSPQPTPFDPQEAYGLLNLRLDWKEVGGYPLDLGLFVTNLTDKLFVEVGQGGAFPQLGVAAGYYNEPRMYGVSLKYSFGM